MIRSIKTVVEIHDAHELILCRQETTKIHRLLNFECLALFIIGKIVASDRIPVFPFRWISLNEHFQNLGHFCLFASLIIEEQQEVVDFLLEVRSVFPANFFGPADGFLELVCTLVKNG